MMSSNTNIQSIQEINLGLEDSFQAVEQFVKSTSDDLFFHKQDGKWSVAENLDHLIRSCKPVASGLKQNKLIFLVFGKAKNGSRSIDEMKVAYQDVLANGAQASGDYLPSDTEGLTKEKLLANWKMIGEKFQERVPNWSEKDIDKYRAPHPVLGKLTIRELLFFTIFHNEHHLKAMKKYV